MRLSAVILATLAAAVAIPPHAAAPGSGDCGTGADAGAFFSNATPLPMPSTLCRGLLANGHDIDVFQVLASEGDVLTVSFEFPEDSVLGSLNLCVYTPSGTLADCAGGQLRFEIHEAGAWRLRLDPSSSLGADYLLSAALKEQVVDGRSLLLHPPVPFVGGVDAILGPDDQLGLDGHWIRLARKAIAGEGAQVTGNLDIRFYDSHFHELPADGCVVTARGWAYDPCAVPPGSEWAFVTSGRDLLTRSWTFKYLY